MSDPQSEALPAPLVSSDIDLRDFPFLPLDVDRLRDSDLAIEATGDEFRAAVLLWCTAWHQAPAASLPDSDKALAAYAGYGRNDQAAWEAVREGALRGFVRCSDGRLYHRLLAEKANEAWEGKLRHRHRRECERIKKAAQRAHVDPVYPTFDDWKAHVAATGSDKWGSPSGDVSNVSPGTNAGQQQGQDEGHKAFVPGDKSGDVPGDVPPTSHLYKGQGEGQGQGEGKGQGSSSNSSLRSSTAKPPTRTQAKLTDQEKAERLAQVTRDAMAAYNATLALPKGLLQRATDIGFDTKCDNVRRCLKVAREICERQYGSDHIISQFWIDYFTTCQADPFTSGRQGGGKGHENWLPDFEYLTRKAVMVEVFEKAASEAGDGE